MKRHTPGPWTVGVYGGISSASGRTIAEVFSDADENVVSAAPELLEALKAVLEELLKNTTRIPDALGATMVQAAKVIAKAEGRDK